MVSIIKGFLNGNLNLYYTKKGSPILKFDLKIKTMDIENDYDFIEKSINISVVAYDNIADTLYSSLNEHLKNNDHLIPYLNLTHKGLKQEMWKDNLNKIKTKIYIEVTSYNILNY